MDDELKRLPKRVTCPDADSPVQVAPDGTRGTFRIVALESNTGKVGWGGQPDIAFPEDIRETGVFVGITTQNVPLYDAGYGEIVEGDLGLYWVAARVADEGICWLRVK